MSQQHLLEIRDAERLARKPITIRCCIAAGCLAARSGDVVEQLRSRVKIAGLESQVHVAPVGCMRLCSQGPLVSVDPLGALYERVTPEQAPSVVDSLNGGEAEPARGNWQQPFFAKQASVVLENSGVIEPDRIETYIAADGYQGLYHALHDQTPSDVIAELTRSGLRGRGGAGYPAGVKWSLVAKSPGKQRFVVCNADEGDPGAFMNRSLIESDPHRILEGMAIAAYAVGASQGYIYVRGEYPLAIERLQLAIKQATKLGLLGPAILGTSFSFQVDIRIGGGAFVCGEETALMASIMGQRGIPTPRPPYPAEHGLWGLPTLLNNVETFANVPGIIRRGAEWFASLGTEHSPGTKVFCLTGQVANAGLVEVPLGTSIHTIVQEIGGGGAQGREIKAVQTGGPSGGCIPAALFETPVDYDSLGKIGSIMGSGGMIVLDETADMVDIARYFMHFCMEESCGKCVPCRAGTVQLHGLLTRILQGNAQLADLQRLEMLCDMVQKTSLCGLGQTAPNPTLSTLRYFPEEFTSRLVGQPAATLNPMPEGE